MNRVPGYFWADIKDWNEAHDSLNLLFGKYKTSLRSLGIAAGHIQDRFEILFNVFDHFALQVCPTCQSVCCFEARVAFDFRDLLFMHSLNFEIPPHQLRRNDSEHCRYLGPEGCLLPRIGRPFVCTWYYCEPMLRLFRRLPAKTQRRLSAIMTEIQKLRAIMEDCFIEVVCSGDDATKQENPPYHNPAAFECYDMTIEEFSPASDLCKSKDQRSPFSHINRDDSSRPA